MSSVITILVWTTLLLDKALLLISFLALSAPLWSFVSASIFLLITFLLGLVHCSAVVLGRAVDGDQLQWLILARVVELVFCSRWDYYDVAGFDVLQESVSVLFFFISRAQGVYRTCSFPATTAFPVPLVKIKT
ncbi:hypothetical protein KCU61_g735, partial [Aureobasidium melanogenum]